jgi:hypothetical protein
VQAKGIHNIINKRITENFPHLQKTMPFQVHEVSSKPKDLTKIELHHNILSLKQQAKRIEKEYQECK